MFLINKEKPLLDLLISFVIHFASNSFKNLLEKNLNHNEEEKDSQCHLLSIVEKKRKKLGRSEN